MTNISDETEQVTRDGKEKLEAGGDDVELGDSLEANAAWTTAERPQSGGYVTVAYYDATKKPNSIGWCARTLNLFKGCGRAWNGGEGSLRTVRDALNEKRFRTLGSEKPFTESTVKPVIIAVELVEGSLR